MKSYLYLAILCLAFGFTSCEKTSDELTVIELTAEERFDRMQKPLILFHSATRQLETGKETGWIVDNQGWVKTYERSMLPGISLSSQSEVLANLELQELYDSASDRLFQLDKADLLNQLELSRAISDQHLSSIVSNSEEKVARGLFAYVQKNRQEYSANAAHGECGPGVGSNTMTNNYTILSRAIIDLSGPESRSATSDRGQELQQWLVDLNQKITIDQ
jgi:hypothetical protein